MSKKLYQLLRLGLCVGLICIAQYHLSVVWDNQIAIACAFAAGVVFAYFLQGQP